VSETNWNRWLAHCSSFQLCDVFSTVPTVADYDLHVGGGSKSDFQQHGACLMDQKNAPAEMKCQLEYTFHKLAIFTSPSASV
jgi:hypothetical protein